MKKALMVLSFFIGALIICSCSSHTDVFFPASSSEEDLLSTGFYSLAPESIDRQFGREVVPWSNDRYEFFYGNWMDGSVRTLMKRDRENGRVTPVCLDAGCIHDEKSRCPFYNAGQFYALEDCLYYSAKKEEKDQKIDVLYRYDLQTGERKEVFSSPDSLGLSFYRTDNLFFRSYEKDEELNIKTCIYRLDHTGNAQKAYEHSIKSTSDICFSDAEHFITYSTAYIKETLQSLVTFYKIDIRTGNEEKVWDIDVSFTGAFFDGRYLLAVKKDSAAQKSKVLYVDLEEMKFLEKAEIPTTSFQLTDRNIYWISGNELHFFDYRTLKETVYTLPDFLRVNAYLENYFYDGIVHLGTQSVTINGKKTKVYDFQYDLLSGQMRYTEEDRSAFYSPEMPAYVIYYAPDASTDSGEAS